MRADLDEMERLLTERRATVVERLLLGKSTPDLANLPRQWKKTTIGTLFSLHNGDRGLTIHRLMRSLKQEFRLSTPET